MFLYPLRWLPKLRGGLATILRIIFSLKSIFFIKKEKEKDISQNMKTILKIIFGLIMIGETFLASKVFLKNKYLVKFNKHFLKI